MEELCCVCHENKSEHMCVVCYEGVCWKDNWAKSCLGVCINCRREEIDEMKKNGQKLKIIEGSLCEDWKPLPEEINALE